MEQVQTDVIEKVRQFHQLAGQLLPVKKILLYGSYAKGRATEHSDIDVAVVVDEPDHAKRVDITALLFRVAFQVDAAIEPKCVFWDEYQHHEKASILSEIIDSGIEIV